MTRKNHNQRMRPSAYGGPSPSPKRQTDRVSRHCRAFRQRTLDYVRSSLRRWSFVFDRPEVSFLPEFQTCDELARLVKKLLASCPSQHVHEVLAYQSIKKGLPDSCECMEGRMLQGLVDNIVNGSTPLLPRGYLAFVKKEVHRLFPKGWDTSYEGFCRRAAPPLTATLECPRSFGGSLFKLVDCDEIDQSKYLDVALFGKDTVRLGPLRGALQVVQSAGKPRPLTTFASDAFFLKPLHKTIYKRLSQQKWLCRGDVTEDKLLAAGFSKELGGVLTSGDYASATDNLSIEVMETCLSAMLENAACVPENIREFAMRACRPTLWDSLDDFRDALAVTAITGVDKVNEPLPPLKKGQMMGSLLSFPLLCLQNYLAFRWSTRKEKSKLPVIINGDDILFQSSRQVSKTWSEVVCRIGLQVEPTKTSVERDWGTLNSTLFSFRGDKLALVPTLRFGMLRPAEYPHSLGTSFHSFVRGLENPVKWRAGHVFFEAHIGELRDLSYSLPSVGFRGALAHRLAVRWGLLDGDRLVGELPEAPQKHSVSLPHDLISEVPSEFSDPELQDLNATETAAWKWSLGFRTAERESEGIRYCLRMTRFRSADVVDDIVTAIHASDREFQYRFGSRARLSVGRPSRKALQDPFFEKKPPRTTVRLFYRISEEVLRRASWFWGPLPSYQEACECWR